MSLWCFWRWHGPTMLRLQPQAIDLNLALIIKSKTSTLYRNSIHRYYFSGTPSRDIMNLRLDRQTMLVSSPYVIALPRAKVGRTSLAYLFLLRLPRYATLASASKLISKLTFKGLAAKAWLPFTPSSAVCQTGCIDKPGFEALDIVVSWHYWESGLL